MNRRSFIKTSSALSLSAAFYNCTPANGIGKALPQNWIWWRPNAEDDFESIKPILQRLVESGVQAILPQVYNSWEALFDHPIIPVKKRWLEEFIPLAHSFGLEVHAWMWSMPLNAPELVAKHPDWFSVNRDGNPSHTHPAYVDYYKFMCPCHPEVREFVKGNVEALAKIEDLDGIHLDYIRQPDVILASALQPKYDIVQDKEYPAYDYPYSDNCRSLFKAQYDYDPMDLGEDAPSDEKWRAFRYQAVSDLVNNYCVPAAKAKNKKITAAVFPNWESVRQAWHQWNLDGFMPMLYHGFYEEDVNWIGDEVQKSYERLNNDKPIHAGLFLGHLPGDQLAKAIQVATSKKAKGYAIFSLEGMQDHHWNILKQISNTK